MPPKRRTRGPSRSTRAGIIFPISRVRRQLKAMLNGPKRVTVGGSIYLAGVLEYMVAELLELSGYAARDNARIRITPRHIMLAYASDEELRKIFRNCILPESGVLPHIHTSLFPVSQIDESSSRARGTKNAKRLTDTTAKIGSKKPRLTKKGQGSFSILAKPTTKAAALKGTAVTTLSERVLIRGQKLTVVQGSIVSIQADAIVHPTNDKFYMGGEVGKALVNAGGEELRTTVAKTATVEKLTNIGDVTISAAPNLSASHLIHVFSPQWDAANQEGSIGDLDKTIINILTYADQTGIKSVALPSIGSGRAHFPKQTAAQTILAAISKYFRQTATSNLQQVFFVLYDVESVNVYTTELQRMVE